MSITQAGNNVDSPTRLTGKGNRGLGGKEDNGRGRRGRLGRRYGLSILSVCMALGSWFLISSLHFVPSTLMPSPVAVGRAFYVVQVQGYRGDTLAGDIEISMIRVGIGFVSATVVGVPLGLLLGRVQWLYSLVDPFVEFFRPLPPLGYLTVLILWFGIGNLTKVILLFLSAVPIIIVACAASVRSVTENYIRVSRSLGLSESQVFFHVILPATLPNILTSLRIGLGVTFGSLVAAEIIASSRGLGYLIYNASDYLQSDIVFMGIITIGVIAVILDRMAVAAERLLVPWAGKA